jgi:hypothetical protein
MLNRIFTLSNITNSFKPYIISVHLFILFTFGKQLFYPYPILKTSFFKSFYFLGEGVGRLAQKSGCPAQGPPLSGRR